MSRNLCLFVCMCREVTEKFASELMNLSELLLKAMSSTLGLDEDYLHMAFGGCKGISISKHACKLLSKVPRA